MLEDVVMPNGMNPEVLEHIMNPQNYGKLESPSGVGLGLDEKTGEYVVFYVEVKDEQLIRSRFATNGCQDTVVIGSMFTQMIEGKTVEYAKSALAKIDEKLGVVTPQQKICANMVLEAFIASLINIQNIQSGAKEEMHVTKMQESCEVEDV